MKLKKIIRSNGHRQWLDGPAVIYPDGMEEYYVDGKHLSEEEYIELRNEYVRSLPIKEYLDYIFS